MKIRENTVLAFSRYRKAIRLNQSINPNSKASRDYFDLTMKFIPKGEAYNIVLREVFGTARTSPLAQWQQFGFSLQSTDYGV